MKSTLLLLALTILADRLGYSQDTSKQGAGKNHFRWSARKAQHLDSDSTLRRSTKLSSNEKKELTGVIAAQIRRFKADFEVDSETELYRIASNTRIKLVDLNDDGIPEVLAQANDWNAGCGATGNCAFWVFRKSANGYDKLLDTRDRYGIGGVEVFRITADRRNGYRDIILGAHESGSEQTLRVYRYDGNRYSERECYVANWVSTEGGQWRQLRAPRISRCSEN